MFKNIDIKVIFWYSKAVYKVNRFTVRPNEKYDIQSDKEILDNINLMFNQIPYYLLSQCFYL